MKYLIVEWVGKWVLPDWTHIGTFRGPYDSKEEAHAAIEQDVQRDRNYQLKNEAERSPSKVNSPEEIAYADKCAQSSRNRFAVITSPDWPTHNPE